MTSPTKIFTQVILSERDEGDGMYQSHSDFMESSNIKPSEECWCMCIRMIMSILSKIPLEKISSEMSPTLFQSLMGKYKDSWDSQEFIFEIEDRLQIMFTPSEISSFPNFFPVFGKSEVKNTGEWVNKIIYKWLPTTNHRVLRW